MKINLKDKAKLQAALDAAQEKQKMRRLDIDRILYAAMDADRKMDQLEIPLKYRVGSLVRIEPPSLPNSYKWAGYGGGAAIKRFSSGWFLVNAGVQQCRKQRGGGFARDILALSDVAHGSIPNQYDV